MSDAERNIRKALALFAQAFPQSKPCIVTRSFPDGDIQLFLHDPDNYSLKCTHAQGQGKTLEEASVALRRHLAVMLTKVKDDWVKEGVERQKAYETTFRRLFNAADEAEIPELPR